MPSRSLGCLAALVAVLLGSCREPEEAPLALFEPPVVHLTERLHEARVETGDAPTREPRTWNAAALHTEWRPVDGDDFDSLATLERSAGADAVHLVLGEVPSPRGPLRQAGLIVDLEPSSLEDWGTVRIEARSHDRFAGITTAVNVEGPETLPGFLRFFQSTGECPPVFSDGSVQTYSIPLVRAERQGAVEELKSLGIFFGAPGEASLDLLSVTLVPRGAELPGAHGLARVERERVSREALYARTPARLAFPVVALGPARLDLGLATLPGSDVTYRVARERGEDREVLFERRVTAADRWEQVSVDLDLSASTDLVLEAESPDAGTALWGSPLIAAAREGDRPPNVVLYVIDGGDADLMSLYAYDRPTTPFLERLAEEGVLFERAHSNSTWTQPSTVSFMTSLQHSVLGGLRRGIHSTPVPTAATTMAEHFRRAGYATASFTTNPNAGRLVGLDRGVDWMRDARSEHHSTSSVELHDWFWEFRDAYPGGPYWVHFQTTDVHEPNEPVDPFAGRFVSEEELEQYEELDQQLWRAAARHFGQTGIQSVYDRALAESGVDRYRYFGTRKGLYDETMLHQDHTLERFVRELKERGEWENTIFVLGSDHGHPAGTYARFGRGLLDPQPEPWQGALFDAYATRVPLLVVWPEGIEGGRRIERPVSMIDVLPTVLELAGLPEPTVLQGQSLAPLLRGAEIESRPVILDEFRVDEATGELVGNLEIVEGRWGASLEIGPVSEGSDPSRGRHEVPAGGRWGAVHTFYPDVPRLLLYDLEEDPFATRAVNDRYPEKVRELTRRLREQWQAHRALATQFGEASDIVLDGEQLEQLKALGYIQ